MLSNSGGPACVPTPHHLSLSGFFDRSSICDLSDKAVSAPVGCLNVLRRLRIVIERRANFPDADLQNAVGHGCLRPDGFDQLIFCHKAARIADQVEQDGEFFRRKGNGLIVTPQTFVNEVEAEISEDYLLF